MKKQMTTKYKEDLVAWIKAIMTVGDVTSLKVSRKKYKDKSDPSYVVTARFK